MKKTIKKILLIFAILYTILNLILYAKNIIDKNKFENLISSYYSEDRDVKASIEIEKKAKEDIERMKEIYGENVPATALLSIEGCTFGMYEVLDGQTSILIVTLILSIIIGIMIDLNEKSKMKEVLYFISGGILFILLGTLFIYMTAEYIDMNAFEIFIDALGESIKNCGIYYVIGYFIVYIFRYRRDKKNVEELNKEIKTKNK